jgi:hypothetical protein
MKETCEQQMRRDSGQRFKKNNIRIKNLSDHTPNPGTPNRNLQMSSNPNESPVRIWSLLFRLSPAQIRSTQATAVITATKHLH